MKERLFVYGTLRFPKYQKEAWGKSFPATRAIAPGFERSFVMVDKNKYVVAWPNKSRSIHGAVLWVDSTALRESDEYEDRYTRKTVLLADGSKAWMYQYRYRRGR
jgi:gamma-glutamylcyclotransferase (GGCT)/AIG2-like uncharacterized protein YtfP